MVGRHCWCVWLWVHRALYGSSWTGSASSLTRPEKATGMLGGVSGRIWLGSLATPSSQICGTQAATECADLGTSYAELLDVGSLYTKLGPDVFWGRPYFEPHPIGTDVQLGRLHSGGQPRGSPNSEYDRGFSIILLASTSRRARPGPWRIVGPRGPRLVPPACAPSLARSA